jgi:hypothetical protein
MLELVLLSTNNSHAHRHTQCTGFGQCVGVSLARPGPVISKTESPRVGADVKLQKIIVMSTLAKIIKKILIINLGICIAPTQLFRAALGAESRVCYPGNMADRQTQ